MGATYRHPRIKAEQQELVRNYVVARSQEGRGYNVPGVVRAALPEVREGEGEDPPPVDCFCSQLVFSAYQRAGLSLGGIRPSRATPQNVIDLMNQGTLEHVEHVLA